MSKKIELKKTVDLTEAGTILKDLFTSLKAGTVCIQKGSDYVTVTPVGELTLEIEAKQKKEKESLSIELSWKLEEEIAEEPVEEFKISAKEPMMAGTEPVASGKKSAN